MSAMRHKHLQPLLAAERFRAPLEQLHEAREVAGALVDARQRLAGPLVPRILLEHLLVEIARAPRVAELRLEDVAGVGAQIAGARRGHGAVGAAGEHHHQLGPLLGLAVDLRHAVEGGVVGGITADHRLIAGQRQVGAAELLGVPTSHAGEQRVLGLEGDVALVTVCAEVASTSFQRSPLVPARRSISSA